MSVGSNACAGGREGGGFEREKIEIERHTLLPTDIDGLANPKEGWVVGWLIQRSLTALPTLPPLRATPQCP
jgi:hypothetical protein